MIEQEIIGYLLPDGMLDYFEITHSQRHQDSYVIGLQEKNIIPEEYKDEKLLSKGFFDPITIQDFPLRGKAFYLQVKRRRWLNTDTNKVVFRDWNLVAKGTRYTEGFASFLKELFGQIPGK